MNRKSGHIETFFLLMLWVIGWTVLVSILKLCGLVLLAKVALWVAAAPFIIAFALMALFWAAMLIGSVVIWIGKKYNRPWAYMFDVGE